MIDCQSVLDIKSDLIKTMGECRDVTEQYCTGRSAYLRLGQLFMRLFAGAGCDGQILVYADMLSMFSDFSPKFVRSFANVGEIMSQAFKDYDAAVKDSSFPAQEHTFKIDEEVLDKLY